MSLFKSGNPALSQKNFQSVFVGGSTETMTLRGTLNKFGFMLVMLMGTAYYSWKEFANGGNVLYTGGGLSVQGVSSASTTLQNCPKSTQR